MSFHFQEPGQEKLLEAISSAANGAEYGGGVFAFATRDGAEAILERTELKELIQRGAGFRLVVGVDAITNARALLFLKEKEEKGFKVRAFVHNTNATFHPKFIWFVSEQSVVLIVGSGNLTLGGMGTKEGKGNWEAFSVTKLDGDDALLFLENIDKWFDRATSEGALLDLDNDLVLEKAVENSRIRHQNKNVQKDNKKPAIEVEHQAQVMLRELPRTRTGQADVGKSGLDFFGYKGVGTDILLQYVSLDGHTGEVKKVHLFVNASRNYRLELSAVSQIGYEVDEDDNRMILIAVKFDECSYRYTILPVSSPGYPGVLSLLGNKKNANSRAMRLRFFEVEELMDAWTDMPDNLKPVSVNTLVL